MILISWVESHFYRQSSRNIWERGGVDWEIETDIYNWPPVYISWGTKKGASGWIFIMVSIFWDNRYAGSC